jgi:hypothetical protein
MKVLSLPGVINSGGEKMMWPDKWSVNKLKCYLTCKIREKHNYGRIK